MKIRFTLLLVCLALISNLSAQYKIERVEPPFWWAGMKSTQLQILVYGPAIAELTPSMDYPGIEMEEVVRVQSPNYLFLILKVDPDVQSGSFPIEFKKNGNMEVYYSYTLRERESSSAMRQGFTNADVIYLITPDRFANGDPGNDYIHEYGDTLDRADPLARHGGDLQGIMDHLDYIKDMGFTSIWLNPVVENKMPRTSYHGYATTDFYKVDPRFGTNEDYETLGETCQKTGIKLIMDMIMNHCGSEHWWMKDLPSEDWINFGGEFVVTNHRRTTIQDPYAPPSEKQLFSDGWFVATMPDMNQRNPLLARYLIQNSIWWVEYAHLQGIRHDTHPYPDKDFMADWSCALLKEYPNFNIVGEEWSPNPALIAYWQKGKTNPDGYTSCMPSMFDFPTQMTLVEGLKEDESWNSGFIKMYESLANDFLYADPYNLVIFPDNHDMSRIYTQLEEDFDLFKMGMAYILTMRGIPQIYYGTEILMGNPGTEEHGVIRSDFPGGWKGDQINAFEQSGLSDQQNEAQSFVKNLLLWRQNMDCLHTGDLIHYSPKEGVYVYFRFNDQQMVMVIMNKNETMSELDTDRFKETIDGKTIARDVISRKTYPLDKLNVPARSVLVLELN
ncbi:MAG: glycoside hydrolase family 13 protein [Bacteroidetes bacterium]|nr:glycoside hydrolase family 13 protein [Bacteroidota bacterium]